MKNAEEQRFVPPDVKEMKFAENKTPHPGPLPVWRGEEEICPQ
jgi:hypothetical protein